MNILLDSKNFEFKLWLIFMYKFTMPARIVAADACLVVVAVAVVE